MRTLRILALGHQLGHVVKGEGDVVIPLFDRLIAHAKATAQYNLFWGEERDIWDERGRTAHEAIFNTANGVFRCVGTQQGYTGFSTWTRGLSWAMAGYAELLEFFETLVEEPFAPHGGKAEVVALFDRAAAATCDFYIAHTATDGIPYWDTGAPRLHELANIYARPSEPENDIEPVDSSAAAIGAQGLIRYGNWLAGKGRDGAETYLGAGPYDVADPARTRLSQRRSRPSGSGAAFPVSSSERLGPCPAGSRKIPPARRRCGAIITCANWRFWWEG